MIELEVKNLQKYFGGNLVFKDINFDVKTKERVGLVGKNGCGKSTVFKIIAGYDTKDKGDILIRKGSKIGYLEQIPKFENIRVKDVLNLGFTKLLDIELEMKSIEGEMERNQSDIDGLLNKYSKLQEEYEGLGGYEKDAKLSKVCVGLNISDEILNRNFDDLSGGQKTRILLGKILIESPDIILLDEPTNHLDMNSVEWLESYLNEYKGCVIIVSHDRYFLDRVVNKVVEIEDLESTIYLGNYSDYVAKKEENLELAIHRYENQQKTIAKMEESIKQLKVFSRNGDNENFVKRAKSMQKRLDKIDKLDNPNKKVESMKINISNNTKQSNDIIAMENGSKSFDDKLLFDEGNMLIRKGENIGLIGANGCGKSTLLRIILGEDKLDSGNISISNSCKIGYLPQNVIFNNEEKSILDWFVGEVNISQEKSREYLAKYLFRKEDVFKKIKSLSGGEKSRLMLSKILFYEVNLLILDEPTNHLDIESIKKLEEVLNEFKGSILFVSHDRYFINKISDKVISIEDNQVISWEGNYDYYKEKNNQRKKSVENVVLVSKIENNICKLDEDNQNNEENQNSKTNKKVTNTYKKAILEKEIYDLELEIDTIDKKLNEVNGDYILLDELYNKKEELEEKLSQLMEKWLDS